MTTLQPQPRCPPDSVQLSYTLVRHIGFVLDELSSQGLELWVDERGSWHWCWRGTSLKAVRGFWALGEALVDAVVTRYPESFLPSREQCTDEED